MAPPSPRDASWVVRKTDQSEGGSGALADAAPADGAPPARAPTPSTATLLALGALALGALAASFAAILPTRAMLVLVLAGCWYMAPGVVIAARLYHGSPSRWAAALLVGPCWGVVATSLAALALWSAGVRSPLVLAASPLLAAAVSWPATSWLAILRVPRFSRRDIAAVCLLMLILPLIVARPYSRVGVDLPDGRAYRAYFTADLVWAMSVVGELSKGEFPPHNPFLRGGDLNYYWLVNLVPAIEHNAAGSRVRLEPILLVNSILLGLGFLLCLYWFTRHFTDSPSFAFAGCAIGILASSFEGAERLFALGSQGAPYSLVTTINVDAVSRWIYHGMPIDGLHRLLLYQSQHATGWALGLSALLIATTAPDLTDGVKSLVIGLVLGAGLLISSFVTLMMATCVATVLAYRILRQRAWRAIPVAATYSLPPLILAFLISRSLHYTDRHATLVDFGVNKLALVDPLKLAVLSFGPPLIGAAAGGLLAFRRRAEPFVVLGLMTMVAAAFYFFVDVRDHQHVYVGWRAGHMLFVAFIPLTAFAMSENWRSGGARRLVTLGCTIALVSVAVPTVAIDLYNTQDVWNRGPAPGFTWTLVLDRGEVAALEWIKHNTGPGSIVQVEPSVRGANSWAYLPAFAERRMAAGLPTSMVPLVKYERASRRVTQLYLATDPDEAYHAARQLGIDYLVIGPPERSRFVRFESVLDERPFLFKRVFANESVSIYAVSKTVQTAGAQP